MADSLPVCANQSSKEAPPCAMPGTNACKNCNLVMYCSGECQKADWPFHDRDCNSEFNHDNWRPDWFAVNKLPPPLSRKAPDTTRPEKHYMGTVPAIDIVKLSDNEGLSHNKPLRLLFAASGDLRNVVKTIAELPSAYNQAVDVTINDGEVAIVARNLIILLIDLTAPSSEVAIDCIIHVWYSAFLRQSHLDLLRYRVRPLLAKACRMAKPKEPGGLPTMKWYLGTRSLEVSLKKSVWRKALSLLDPVGIRRADAVRMRKAITLSHGARHRFEADLLLQDTSQRIALWRYREEGLLLPFGASREGFCHPNPTLYDSEALRAWPVHAAANPLSGWSPTEVGNTRSSPAGDVYGQLSVMLREVLYRFYRRQHVSFKIVHKDAYELWKTLDLGSFDRIEVSNMADGGQHEINFVLANMMPLLRSPFNNPNATLITLFLNAVDEMSIQKKHQRAPEVIAEKHAHGGQYLPLVSKASRPALVNEYLRSYAVWRWVVNCDDLWEEHVKQNGFEACARRAGAEPKEHTIVDEWPFIVKLAANDTDVTDEVVRLVRSSTSGSWRYVEWQRGYGGFPPQVLEGCVMT
ncbi:hypothetical protein C8035_v004783 [Colletotrichum spinosum]|uniref:MYND-type domain-containing protein n=1 Tax=Colletotrichum spinosum TaxID=1347390 RepID=A0A4R8QPT9_9PEZI|nr:hypothetical protein C8035_v004783 [Colletotrichum spinosum]